jgi:hypothetical protein
MSHTGFCSRPHPASLVESRIIELEAQLSKQEAARSTADQSDLSHNSTRSLLKLDNYQLGPHDLS